MHVIGEFTKIGTGGIVEGNAFESYRCVWPGNDYNKLEGKAVAFFQEVFNMEIKYKETLNGVVCLDVGLNTPSVWFIMNSVDPKNPDDNFLCPRALNA